MRTREAPLVLAKEERETLDPSGNGSIPAFLSIDVEPDGFQLPRQNAPAWPGYGAMFEFADRLRSRLAERSGTSPGFGWYFRTDPQIAEVYGRPDHVLREFPERISRLAANGDYFGVHAHPIRWSERRRSWVHDFADGEWLVHCTSSALDAYAHWSGAPCQRSRCGGAGFLTNDIVETLERHGVKVELSLEPVAGWGLTTRKVATAIDASPMVGAYTDCRMAPRVPFRPARDDFRIADRTGGRDLLMVPVTTGPPVRPRPVWRRLARRIVLGSAVHEVLFPSVEWPSERFYWDVVARQLESMNRPYLSLGIRTDSPDSAMMVRVRRLFDELPQHPLAERLRFLDPLDAIAQLV